MSKRTNEGLRRKVRMFYDMQRLRQQAGGRTKPKAEGAEVHLSTADLADLKMLEERFFEEEKVALAVIAKHLKEIPFYRDVLSKSDVRWRGVGPTMAGVILSELDIHRADTPSQWWSFAGLGVWHAHRCKLCHRVVECTGDNEYQHRRLKHNKIVECARARDTLGRIDVYESGERPHRLPKTKLKYNSYLRTRMWVLSGVLVRQIAYRCPRCHVRLKKLTNGETEWLHPHSDCALNDARMATDDIWIEHGYWRERYLDYKHRKESAGWGVNAKHRDNAAKRYIVKQLLLEIWREWRKYEGLPVRPSYQEEYLGHSHHAKIPEFTQPVEASQ